MFTYYQVVLITGATKIALHYITYYNFNFSKHVQI